MTKIPKVILILAIALPLFSMAGEVIDSAQDLDGAWTCTTYAAKNNGDSRCTKASDLLFLKQGVLNFNAESKSWKYAGATPVDGFEGCRSELASSGKYDAKANHLILSGNLGVYVYPLGRPNPTTFTGYQPGLNAFFVCKKN